MGEIAQMMGGLPMNELIGAPLVSVVDAQRDLAKTMISYVNEIGYAKPDSEEARMLKFKLTKPVINDDGVTTTNVEMQAPMLGLLPMPALLVDKVTVDFQMEVTTATSSSSKTNAEVETEVSARFWRIQAKVRGKVSTARENTRSTNQTAKYQVHVEANQQPQTECLNKLMDMFAQCTEPVDIRSGEPAKAAA
ncbi:MAG: DUF2589 domain-containing protein [Treponema sp.]|nr:DUF2589 domain-containing protein [Treponema sp.]